ncbi:MAG: hypothetical protein ACRDSH_16045 [Pseudonocardiaceae bacterium]
MNSLSDTIKDSSGTKIIASYDNAGSATITTKAAPANCTITRPNQGGSGTDALVASLQANDGCVQFARAVTDDSKTAKRTGKNLTYIPFAIDALTYAIRSDSTIPKDLSAADLTSIYNCQVPGIQPLLGVFGAGNRTFFLQKLGFTDSATFAGSAGHECVKDTDSNGNPLLANDGRLLTAPNQLVTYSSAPYLAQVNGVGPDIHGKAILGSINGISPAILNNSSFMSREVFNVVSTPQASDSSSTVNKVFVGPSSSVCSNSPTIQRYGFNTDPNCGSTAIHTN